MADVSDVEASLVTLISEAVYPDGTDQQSAVGAPVRVYRGWPNASKLDTDLAAGIVNITVFPQNGQTRNTTRFPLAWQTVAIPTPTIQVSTASGRVTFGGVAGAGNLCGIRSNGVAYAYAAGMTDTPSTIAAALGAQIPGATVSGPVVLSNAGDLLGRVVGNGATQIQETRRQTQLFLISMWCPSPPLRDLVGSTVDGFLAPIEFIPLSDGTGGRLIYRNSFTNDVPTKDALWRRDLTYSVEYGTTRKQTASEMLWGLGSTVVQVETATGPVEIATVNWEPS